MRDAYVTRARLRPVRLSRADNRGVHLHLRQGLLDEFKWFTVLAGMCTCMQFAITALLVMGREQVVDIFDLKGCDPNMASQFGDLRAMKLASGHEAGSGGSYQGGGTFA